MKTTEVYIVISSRVRNELLQAAKAHLECLENDMQHLGSEEQRELDVLRQAIKEAEGES